MRRLPNAGLTTVVLIFVALAVLARPAGAHASLQSSSPAADETVPEAPRSVVLRFDEPVDAGLGGVQVTSPTGERVDDGAPRASDGGRAVEAAVSASLRGTYTVVWNVVSEDGHPIRGTFVFHVGEATGSGEDRGADRPVLQAANFVMRWVAFAGTFVAVGTLVFSAWVMYRSAGAGVPFGRLRRLYAAGAAGAVVGAGLGLLTQTALAAGRPPWSVLDLVVSSLGDIRFITLGVVRAGLAALALAAGALPWRDRSAKAVLAVSAVPAIGALVVPAVAGHAWTAEWVRLAVGADIVHLLAGAVWFGGLAAVAAAAVGTDLTRLYAGLFAELAFAIFIVVAVTGTVSAWVEVGSLHVLISSAYGRVLLAKLGLFFGIVVLAWLNRYRLLPDAARALVLRRSIWAELLLGGCVLAVTAILVGLPTARGEQAKPVTVSARTDTGVIDLTVSPARAGSNELHLYFLTDAGLARDVDAAVAQVARGAEPPRKIDLRPVTASHYVAPAVTFPRQGRWRVLVTSITAGVSSTETIEINIV
jgi:copper transport protein